MYFLHVLLLSLIALCLSHSPPKDNLTRACRVCPSSKTDYGYYGMFTADHRILELIEDKCLESWITEDVLQECWTSVSTPNPKKIPNRGTAKISTSESYFFSYYGFKMTNNMTLQISRKGGLCKFLSSLRCFKPVSFSPFVAPGLFVPENFDTTDTIIHQPPTPSNRLKKLRQELNAQRQSSLFITSNIPVENYLRDDKGPATYPKLGVLLFGYYYAAFKNSISFYYLNEDPTAEATTECDCEKWVWTPNFFTLKRYRCKVNQDGCVISMKGVRMEVSLEEAKNHCDDDHTMIRARYPRITSFKDKHQTDNFMICNNGTIMEEKNSMRVSEHINKDHLKCESWTIIDTYEQCEGSQTEETCNIGDIEHTQEDSQSIIKTKKPGFVQVKSDTTTFKVQCDDECTVTFPKGAKTVIVTCPSGFMREFILDKVETKCPFIESFLSSSISTYICRMTYRPTLVWAIFAVAGSGWMFFPIIYLIIDSLIYVVYLIIKGCTLKKLKNDGSPFFEPRFCSHCELLVTNDEMAKRHRVCYKSVCPFCRVTQKVLKDHVCDCKIKEEVEKENTLSQIKKVVRPKDAEKNKRNFFVRYLRGYKNRNHMRHIFPRICIAITTIILFGFVISPVSAKVPHGTVKTVDEWDMFIEQEDGCPNECFHSNKECCNGKSPLRGKRSISEPITLSHRFEHKAHIPLNTSFTPVVSYRSMDLTFNTKSEAKGKVIISGKSQAIIEVEKMAGMTWTISNHDSDEKVKLSVGIKDFGQEYKIKFNNWFADRKVLTGSDNVCTGDCQSDCGCKSKTCKIHKKENVRKWTCNPTWCWNIGGGCSCCYMEASLVSPKFLIAEFDIEFENTFLDLCVSIGTDKFKCKKVTHTSSFLVESVSVKMSRVYNVQRMINGKIHLIYHVHEKQFNIKHPDSILIDADICSASNCRHGEVGDYRFTNISTLLYEGGEKMTEDGVEMIWGGVQQSMDCTSFHWPTCNQEGITIQTSDMFSNLIAISKKLTDDYIPLETKLSLDLDLIPELMFKIQPKEKAGQVQLFISVDGMKLNKKNTHIVLKTYNIKRCFGCKNCYQGFTCLVDISISSPETAYLHFRADNNLVLSGEQSVVATKKLTSHNLTFFSTVDISTLRICIEEISSCKTVYNITLQKPINRLSNQGSFFTLKSKDDGSFNFQFLGNFFKNFLYMFTELLKSPIFYAVLFLVILFIFIVPISKKVLGFRTFNTKKHDFSKIE